MSKAQPGVQRVLQSRAETRAFYDRISRFYDVLAERSEGPLRHAGLQRLNPRPGEILLEIGYGTGHGLVEMAHAVGTRGQVYGIDLSPGMRARAERLVNREGLAPRVVLICGDATRMPYPTAAFDGIYVGFTLELFDTPDIPKVLGECRRVLKPAGRMVVVGLTKEGRDALTRRALEWAHRRFPRLVDCRPIFVGRALLDAGFDVRSDERIEGRVPVEIVRARR